MRIEIERALHKFTTAQGVSSKRPMSISAALRELREHGVSPPGTDRFLDALSVMNEAVHSFDVDSTALAEALSVGTAFLAEKRREILGDEQRAAQAAEVSAWLREKVSSLIRDEQVTVRPSERLALAAAIPKRSDCGP